jgi:hypothetical protein
VSISSSGYHPKIPHKNPKLPAPMELKALVGMMKKTDSASFESGLNEWFLKLEKIFKRKNAINTETGKSHDTHKKG